MAQQRHESSSDRQAAIERLIDADLPADEAAGIERDARGDKRLRAQIRHARWTDGLIADALTRPRASRRRTPPVVWGGAALAGAAVVALVVLVLGPLSGRGYESTSDDQPEGPRVAQGNGEPDLSSSGGQLVLFEVVGSTPPERSQRARAGDPASGAADERTADGAAAQDSSQEEARYAALGRALRSAQKAHATLDAMTPSEQLAAVRVWVRQPSLRPIAFDRLRALAEDPSVRERAVSLARTLAEDADLAPWVSGRGVLRVAMR